MTMEQQSNIVPSKASQMKKQELVDVVVFTKKKPIGSKPSQPTRRTQSQEPEFNVKQATKEIIRMGTKGFYKFKREKTLKSLAIELGAKPDKKRYRNYKELKELRKVQKEKRDKRLNMLKESSNLSLLNHFNRKYAKKKQKKNDYDILNRYGKIK